MMTTRSAYLSESRPAVVARPHRRPVMLVFLMIFTMFFGSLAAASVLTAKPMTASAEDESFDPGKWLMCRFGKESYTGLAYQILQTDDMEFVFFSKSALSSGGNDVVMGPLGMNWMLDKTGTSFRDVNEQILGRPLVEELGGGGNEQPQEGQNPEEEEKELEYNGGERVNPFDRFGVAGLSFTSYMGEWNYVSIDACSDDAEPEDRDSSKFYEGRLIPQSTWDDRENSQDVRTLQHKKGYFNHFISSLANLTANFIFVFAKLIVVLAVSLIGFAFSDIVSLVGLTDYISGENPNDGIFGYFYQGIFQPLIVMFFGIVGVSMLFQGVFRRRYRNAMFTLLRSVALYVAALAIALNPAFFVALPNTIAVFVQTMVVQSLSTSIAGGSGLCATDVGGLEKATIGGNASSPEALESAAQDIRSTVGCSFWQEFLFRPWSQAQFGVDWNQTWAKGETAEWADKDTSAAFNNDDRNAKMVGNAEVPLGGGEVVNNWALFQLSTQTNVHAPIDAEGKPGLTVSGISSDWWRIVDVVSNYAEVEEEVEGAGDNGSAADSSTAQYNAPDPSAHVLDSWDSWVGNSPGGRVAAAASATLVAAVGVAPPLVFSLLSAVYAFGVALLSAFAPLFLLIGISSNRGWEICKSWLELLVNTVLRRIVLGVLMILSIMFTSVAIRIMEGESWWEGAILMLLLAYVLLSSRKRIVDNVASLRFASYDMSYKARRIGGGMIDAVKGTARVGTSTAVAGAASRRAGGQFMPGAIKGARHELRGYAHRSGTLRSAFHTYESLKSKDPSKSSFLHSLACMSCGEPLDERSTVYYHFGQYLCEDCAARHGDVDTMEVIDVASWEEREEHRTTTKKVPVKTVFTRDKITERTRIILNQENQEKERLEALYDIGTLTGQEISTTMEAKQRHRFVQFPKVPEEIQPYVDVGNMQAAWQQGKADYVNAVYSQAWASWFYDSVEEDFVEPAEDVVDTLMDRAADEIDETGQRG